MKKIIKMIIGSDLFIATAIVLVAACLILASRPYFDNIEISVEPVEMIADQ